MKDWTVKEWDQAFVLRDGDGNFIENFYDKDKNYAHQIAAEHNALAKVKDYPCVCIPTDNKSFDAVDKCLRCILLDALAKEGK